MEENQLQKVLISNLSDIETIEKELDSQLGHLGKTVDKGFFQIKNIYSNTLSMVIKSVQVPQFMAGVLIAQASLGAIVGAVVSVKAAIKHNKSLDELLVLKQQTAVAKINQIHRLHTIADNVLHRLNRLFKNETGNSYETSQLTKEILDSKISIMDRTLSLYRVTLYSKLIIQFLEDEYDAWLNGRQKSDMHRPTYYDCNKIIVSDFSKLNGADKKVFLSHSKNGEVDGYELYKAFDVQILSCILVDSQMYSSKDSVHIKGFSLPANKVLKKLIRRNKAYKRFRKSLFLFWLMNFFNEYAFACILAILFVFLDYWFFSWVNWNAWIEWTVGIIGGILELAVLIVGSILYSESHVTWMDHIYRKARNKQLALAGYVRIYRPDLQKHNLVKAGVKGFFGGITTALFN